MEGSIGVQLAQLSPRTGSKPVLGLVGGIGSGKSAVAEDLCRHGARDSAGDRLGHEALEQPDIRERVVRRWGAKVVGNDSAGPEPINRRHLGRIVFADPAERFALEAIVFPYIERR